MKTYKFGDYVKVEMFRHGADNEMYIAKVIGGLMSNTFVNVPIRGAITQRQHDEMEKVIRIIICGVSETSVIKVRVQDVEPWEVKGLSAEQCLKNELNTERLTPIQWDGILRAMENYKNR